MTAPELSAFLVVRDEQDLVGGCLDEVTPLVDEVIVIDTGSRDATPDIARAKGCEVHSVQWADDFSAARNFALARCRGDWVIAVDADELVHEVAPGAMRRALHEFGDEALMIRRRSFTEDDRSRTDAFDSWHARVFRPSKWHYQGRVHERLVARPDGSSTVAVMFSTIWLTHDGYRPSRYRGKRRRDERLALLDLADRPTDWRVMFEVARASPEPETRHRYFSQMVECAPEEAGTLLAEAWIGLADARWMMGDRAAAHAALGEARLCASAPRTVAIFENALTAADPSLTGKSALPAALTLAIEERDGRAVLEIRRITPGLGP